MGQKGLGMDGYDDVDGKIERVEEIRSELQEAESMNPADAKRLHDEAMDLLDDLEDDLDLGDGEILRE
ncbi:hypothetical protein ACOJIV_21440 [Haloarcula sp. AONF1]